MDKLTLALVIAQNGLKVAAASLSANATKTLAKADGTADKTEAAKLKKKATKSAELAKALTAADAGITSYLTAE
ncbi:MAG: hypothetical protein ACKV2V_16360 [Blastocatellia bacterium]